MSYQLTALNIHHGPREHGAWCVAAVIAEEMRSDSDTVLLSTDQLADRTRLGRNTVKRAVRWLVDTGWLRYWPGGGRGHANRYQLAAEMFAQDACGKCPQTCPQRAPLHSGGEQKQAHPEPVSDLNRPTVDVNRPTVGLPPSVTTPSSSRDADQLLPLLAGVTDSDDDWDATALAGLPVGRTAPIRKRLARARSAGWTASDLNAHLKAGLSPTARGASAMRLVTMHLNGLPPAPQPKPERPAWCGQCDEPTRMVETDRGMARCPDCHPASAAGTTNGRAFGAADERRQTDPAAYIHDLFALPDRSQNRYA